MKDRDDPVALEEHEYPEWLWRCLDVKKDSDALDEGAGDEFCTQPPRSRSRDSCAECR
jgi:large subunit ribosomal protein L54